MSIQRWLQKLTATLDFIVTRASAADADAAIFEIDDSFVTLHVRQRGGIGQIACCDADEAGFQQLARKASEHGLPHLLVLRVPPAVALQKRLTVPAAARRHLEGLLGFEMDRETPYARDEVYWHYSVCSQDAAQGRLEIDLVVVPRSFVDPLVAMARRAGLDPAGIEVTNAAGKATLVRFSAEKKLQWLRSQRPLVAMAAAACLLAVVAVALPFIRQQQALAAANAAVEPLTAQAQEAATLRQSIDQVASTAEFLKNERDRNGSALAALANATHALPDDTYLTALSMHQGRLTMTGVSPSAAKLVGSLAQSPVFHEPAFDSPVVENGNGGLETFTISVTLKPAGSS